MFQSLLQKHCARDNAYGTDKDTTHSYGPLYEEILAPYRYRAERVLEIGVYSGASVQVLSEYFTKAHVYGIDISMERILDKYKNNPRTTFANIDGTNPNAPQQLGSYQWDVIIEDASHIPNDQVASLDIFAPYIKKGGMYVLEDIADSTIDYIRPRLQEVANRHGLYMMWYDLRHIKNQFDDVVAVFYA